MYKNISYKLGRMMRKVKLVLTLHHTVLLQMHKLYT